MRFATDSLQPASAATRYMEPAEVALGRSRSSTWRTVLIELTSESLPEPQLKGEKRYHWSECVEARGARRGSLIRARTLGAASALGLAAAA